jgi:hypothetical protein
MRHMYLALSLGRVNFIQWFPVVASRLCYASRLRYNRLVSKSVTLLFYSL